MAARKPRKTTARRTTATAKIRVHTDEYGRKVYSIVGTKKFAYTLAKAKEIASKSKASKKRASTKKSTALTTTRKRKATTTKRRTTARRTTGAKRNAKGQFVKAKRTTRRNGDPSMSAIHTKHFTQSVLRDAEFEVYSTLSKPGLPDLKGQLAIVTGRNAGLEVAENFLDNYGLTHDVYREDNPRTGSIIFRGKVGSGVKGLLEISANNEYEVKRAYVRRGATFAGRLGRVRGVKEGMAAAGTLLYRNAVKISRASLAKARASSAAKLDERNARLIQSDATYDVYSNLYTRGRKPQKGRSVGQAEGKREAVRLAEAYIAEQGLEGMLYREDIGNSVTYGGKVGSGLAGMIEAYPINDDEVIAKYAEMKFTALARRNRR